ncbi:hypothetical protein [Streptomyces sp. CAU 1734]|uniref:hypothetical protein n=1 Tax=Streptomyces sp. CAU 1734 TaxID=3140360 RepID=UPI003260DEBA
MPSLTTLSPAPPHSGTLGTVLPWRSLASLGIEPEPAPEPAAEETPAGPGGAGGAGGAGASAAAVSMVAAVVSAVRPHHREA